MLKSIKITCDRDKLFFWSDFHHGHDKPFIFEKRGFKTVAEHDEALIARWNETVPADGVVFHLGDFQIQSDEGKFWQLVRRLNFKTLYHLWGNHPSGAKQAYHSALRLQFPNTFPEVYEVYPLSVPVDGNPHKTIVFLPEYVEVHVGKIMLTLCHYPISSWHHMGKGVIHLCGHSHGSLKEKIARRIDVGVENYPHPVSLQEIIKTLEGVAPACVDHHSSQKSAST